MIWGGFEPDSGEEMRAGVGYFVTARTAGLSDLLVGEEQANVLRLKPGWNCVGPARTSAVPTSLPVVWGVDRGRYFRLDDELLPDWQLPNKLMQGRGYWIHSNQTVDIDLESAIGR